jgi:N-acetylneuraminic acid mutarotase
MAAPPSSFAARSLPAAAAANGKWFIFGGRDRNGNVLDSAAIYDLATDSWRLLSNDSATPSAREMASAVWVGSQVVVFGGRNASGSEYYLSGALYDPATDRWSTINSSAVARAAGVGVAASNHAIFWGGLTTGATAASGASRYDMSTNSWQPASTQNGPSPMLGVAWALGGDSLFLYGGLDGNTRKDTAFRYDLVSDAWTALARGPKARSSAFGTSDGRSFYVWGGRDGNTFLGDGAIYGMAWAAMSSKDAPSARCAPPREQGWAFALGTDDVVFLGGQNDNGDLLTDGGRYSTSAGWSSVPSWPSREEHDFGVAALISGEVLVWGGIDGNNPTTTGERWAP